MDGPDADRTDPTDVSPATVGAIAHVFVDDPASPVLDDDDFAHLSRSLRLRDGEVVVAADGRGRWCTCRYRGGSADRAIEPDGPLVDVARSSPPVTVAFALVKGERPDWAVQKLTEIGVDRIVPLLADRSVVVWEGDRATKGIGRLRRVAKQAAMQSRRAWLPEVTEMQTVVGLATGQSGSVTRQSGMVTGPGGATTGKVDTTTGDVDAVTGEGGSGLLTLAQPGGDPPRIDRLMVAVGPEGGWSPEELDLGLQTMGLGPTVLRVETAAMAAGVLLCALRSSLVLPA